MDQAFLFQELEALAAELEVEVRYDDLASRGGLCRVGDRTCLFVNRDLSLVERVDVFADGLAALPLDGVFIRPLVRDLLESRAAASRV